ncbi:helix-turn-helix transcriptional regulator [Sphingobium fuliginis]|uniref:helix-turn-helix transcriptional regulator n=1 Tax=Sphingobium fuliginis (strain ATCC 27551) TaxID=336203 RepID=UPI00142F9DFE|nr:autoinducer binding domain-containing protein [Sphingobium fuliginis]
MIETHSDLAQRCATAADLFAVTRDAAQEIGFEKLALVHNLWFRCPGGGLIRMDNFGEWGEIFIARKYYLIDPVLLACQRTNTAFSWLELAGLLPRITPEQCALFSEAARHRLRIGFSLPVGVMGEPVGCCSFAIDAPELPSRKRCRATAMIAAEAFREARRLHGFPARAAQIPHLSPRRHEVLQLVALGKSDPEIAIILGIGEPTVRSYMTDLRRLFDVYSRTQLATAALRFGLVAFEDAIPAS